MKKTTGIAVGICVLGFFAWLLLSRFSTKGGRTLPGEISTVRPREHLNEGISPTIIEDYAVVEEEELGLDIGPATSSHMHVWPKGKLWVYGHAYAPPELPRLEIRFRRPSLEGGMKPCKLGALIIQAWREGGRNMLRRTPQELSFPMGFKQQGIEVTGAKAIRTLITNNLKLKEFQGLYMGRMYYLKFQHLGFEGTHETPDKWGSCLLRVPDDVPPGKVVVMEIDVTQKFDPHQVQMHVVRVHVRGKVPGRGLVQMAVPGGRTQSARVQSDGTARIQVEKLGGELAVLSFLRQDVGHLLYYKREVQSEEVRFPEDADVTVSAGEVLKFRIRVPREGVPTQSQGLALLMHRDSSVPVGGMEFAEVDGWERGDEELPASIPLLAAPGSYYVAYNFRNPTVIGKLNVGQFDAGKTLQVQPVEE
jgi:hypothetical protein